MDWSSATSIKVHICWTVLYSFSLFYPYYIPNRCRLTISIHDYLLLVVNRPYELTLINKRYQYQLSKVKVNYPL